MTLNAVNNCLQNLQFATPFDIQKGAQKQSQKRTTQSKYGTKPVNSCPKRSIVHINNKIYLEEALLKGRAALG